MFVIIQQYVRLNINRKYMLLSVHHDLTYINRLYQCMYQLMYVDIWKLHVAF